MKIDEKLLHKYGYVPGEYFYTCSKCREQEIGEKRCTVCKKCAMESMILALVEKIKQLEEYKDNLKPIHNFLLGAAPLNGIWFDECDTNFKWRGELYKVIDNSEIEVTFKLKEK